MYVIWLKIKALLEETSWRIKDVFIYLFRFIITLIFTIINVIRNFIFKLIMMIVGITNLGFLVGLYLLYLNVGECMQGINFVDTKYFNTMAFLCGIHIILIIICIVIKPKNLKL